MPLSLGAIRSATQYKPRLVHAISMAKNVCRKLLSVLLVYNAKSSLSPLVNVFLGASVPLGHRRYAPGLAIRSAFGAGLRRRPKIWPSLRLATLTHRWRRGTKQNRCALFQEHSGCKLMSINACRAFVLLQWFRNLQLRHLAECRWNWSWYHIRSLRVLLSYHLWNVSKY